MVKATKFALAISITFIRKVGNNMDDIIQEILMEIDELGFEGFEDWFGQSEFKTSDHVLLVVAVHFWEANTFRFADMFKFEDVVDAVDHLLCSKGY